jgi:hypothetical protein
MRTKTAALLFVLCLIHSAPILGAEPKWSEINGEEEIAITVNQEDGATRELTIWFAVVDGQGYIRTRDTSWRVEMERDPNVSLRIAGRDYPVRVSAVAEGALYDRVNAAYTEKYGMMSNVVLATMRPFLGAWNIYRADSR